jgi:hypothetical protein
MIRYPLKTHAAKPDFDRALFRRPKFLSHGIDGIRTTDTERRILLEYDYTYQQIRAVVAAVTTPAPLHRRGSFIHTAAITDSVGPNGDEDAPTQTLQTGRIICAATKAMVAEQPAAA